MYSSNQTANANVSRLAPTDDAINHYCNRTQTIRNVIDGEPVRLTVQLHNIREMDDKF